MNCFTVLGIEPTTEKKTIKRAYAAKSREFHPEEHPEEFQRIHDAYEEALAWAERNAGREEEPQMPEEPRRMEMGAAEQEKAAESETWNYAEPERNPEEKMYSQKNLLRSMKNFLCILTKILRKVSGKKRQESHLYS